MWRHIAQSLQGRSHAADGSPCQDTARVRVVGEGEAQTLIACVADGAGTAAHASEGSRIACESIVEHASEYFEARGSWDGLAIEDVIGWCEEARRRIREEALSRACSTREFATTLCAALLAPQKSFFFQIGDGAIILRSGGIYGVVFWPQSGEYANSTNFLTADDFRVHLEFGAAAVDFSDVALFTDGLERLALQFETRTPHPPFFSPLFDALRSAADQERLSEDLRRFLQSDSVRARSDDDTTLILASRLSGPIGEAA